MKSREPIFRPCGSFSLCPITRAGNQGNPRYHEMVKSKELILRPCGSFSLFPITRAGNQGNPRYHGARLAGGEGACRGAAEGETRPAITQHTNMHSSLSCSWYPEVIRSLEKISLFFFFSFSIASFTPCYPSVNWNALVNQRGLPNYFSPDTRPAVREC